MWQLWLIASGIFFVGEIFTIGFVLFWFGIGALIAMITSFFVSNVILQTIIFLVSSTILVIFTKPLMNQFTKKDNTPTNVYSFIGKQAIVTEDIENLKSKGQIKISGEIWSASSSNDDENIKKDTKVKIIEVKGVKAIVTPIE